MIAFFKATNDTIKIIGRLFDDIRSEGWLAENKERFVTEGGQREISCNNALPQLGIEVRQKPISGSVNEVEMQGDCLRKQYSPKQRKFVESILHRFKDLFERKSMLTNCEIRTNFYDPLSRFRTKVSGCPFTFYLG